MPKKIPKKYVPSSLTPSDKKKQIDSIKKGTPRPKLKSFTSKRSSHVEKFEKMYGYKVTNKSKINQELLSNKGQELVLNKGRAAYYSGGSRPNQTPSSWAYARMASALTGGKSAEVDKSILKKYGKGKIKKKYN